MGYRKVVMGFACLPCTSTVQGRQADREFVIWDFEW
jgi:hypothetical protein